MQGTGEENPELSLVRYQAIIELAQILCVCYTMQGTESDRRVEFIPLLVDPISIS